MKNVCEWRSVARQDFEQCTVQPPEGWISLLNLSLVVWLTGDLQGQALK